MSNQASTLTLEGIADRILTLGNNLVEFSALTKFTVLIGFYHVLWLSDEINLQIDQFMINLPHKN